MTAALPEFKHWPPYTTPNEKPYAVKHVKLLEFAIDACKQHRTAVQAGGNIGYWPRRMAQSFHKVVTFEPEWSMYDCLAKNLADYENVEVRRQAVGPEFGLCSVERKGFGSHTLVAGHDVEMVTIDSLDLDDVDLIQLDIEGYELQALIGAARTIKQSRPVIQVEILDRFPGRHKQITEFLGDYRYIELKSMARDYVFSPA